MRLSTATRRRRNANGRSRSPRAQEKIKRHLSSRGSRGCCSFELNIRRNGITMRLLRRRVLAPTFEEIVTVFAAALGQPQGVAGGGKVWTFTPRGREALTTHGE